MIFVCVKEWWACGIMIRRWVMMSMCPKVEASQVYSQYPIMKFSTERFKS